MSPESQQLLFILRTALRIRGLTQREVERRMGLSTSYLSRLLAGRVELKVDHVAGIARVLGLEPGEIFVIVFSGRSDPMSEAAAKARAAVEHLIPRPSPAAGLPAAAGVAAADAAPAASISQSASSDLMEERVTKVLQRFFRELAGRLAPHDNAPRDEAP